MTQAQNVAIESSQINSSGVLLTTGGGTGLSTVGTNGQVLTSNGTTLSWVTPTTTSPGGSTTQVQYNSSGSFAGSANFTFDGANINVGGYVLLTNNQYHGIKDTTGNAVGFPIFTGSNDAIFGYLAGGTTGISTYQFRTGNNVERMRIDSAGNVGIGTNNPTYTLQVAGNAYTNQTVISGNNVIITSTNLNSLKTAGNYIGYNLTNAPSASGSAWCTVEVFTNGSDQVFQRATPAQYASNSVWNRMSVDGGTTWGSWIKESGTGGVLQTISYTSSTTFSTASSSATATGFIISITPSSTSSKILFMLFGGNQNYGSGSQNSEQFYIYRQIGSGGYTNIQYYSGSLVQGSTWGTQHSAAILDTPATTSTVYYQPYMLSNGPSNLGYFNNGGTFTMILMEIAG